MVCSQPDNNSLPDCYDTSVYNDTTRIVADPDIAGIGVISAFVITAGLALVLSFVYVVFDSHPKIDRYIKHKEKWLKLLEQLILTLSDQQLVTGLAILVAAFVRWNEISVYHWDIVSNSAFVSSNTHISTLVVLRRAFCQKSWWWARLWRIIAMVVFAIMLFVANIYTGYTYWDDYTAWPMRCVAQELKRDLRGNYQGTSAWWACIWAAFLGTNHPIAIAGLFENVCAWTRESLRNKRIVVQQAYRGLTANNKKGNGQSYTRVDLGTAS